MKRKNKELGVCGLCGKETYKTIPKPKSTPNANRKVFYCGCKGVRAL